MEGYEYERLPSFDADFEKTGLREKELSSFLKDFLRKPRYLKQAEDLKSILEPHWSCHFHSSSGLFVIIYFICDGRRKACPVSIAEKESNALSPNINSCPFCKKEDLPQNRIVLKMIGRHDESYRRLTRMS